MFKTRKKYIKRIEKEDIRGDRSGKNKSNNDKVEKTRRVYAF